MKSDHMKVLIAVLVTYLVISFVPSIGLINLLHHFSGGSGSGG